LARRRAAKRGLIIMAHPTFAQLSRSRSNNFDFLRFFLAFVVIYTHAFALCGVHWSSWSERLRHGDFGGAWLAVDGFFILSGFLITQSYFSSGGLGDFWKKRVLRIYPGFAAAILFCVLIVGPLGGANLSSYFRDWRTYAFFQPLALRDVVTLPGVFASAPMRGMVNGSIWTIRFELICYALTAALGMTGLLGRRYWVLGVFAVSLAVGAAQVGSFPNHRIWERLIFVPYFGNLYEMPRFLSCFLAGTSFYLFRDRLACSGVIAMPCVLAMAATFWASSVTVPIFGAYLLFYFAFSGQIRLHHWGRRGDFSYGLYLYAFPVQQLLVHFWNPRMQPFVLLAASFAITMGLAFLSWHGVEQPLLKLKNPRKAQSRQALAARMAA
jgi:peptidoglycan/LPS O-acetylase OafA/YrhL